MTRPSVDDVRRAPEVLLHDHLDGGLRPATVVELAAETGYAGLPTTDPDELSRVVPRQRRRGVAAALSVDVRPHGRGQPGGTRREGTTSTGNGATTRATSAPEARTTEA